jgi:hypothetical protein
MTLRLHDKVKLSTRKVVFTHDETFKVAFITLFDA